MPNRYFKYGLLLSAFALISDQITKFYALKYLSHGEIINVAPFFDLLLAWNKGVSFGMFNSGAQLTLIILSSVAVAVTIFLSVWMYRSKDIFLTLALGGIIGGALGNLIDRLRYGAVVDFLEVYWKTHHFPTFNIADSFICVGVAVILLMNLKKEN